MRVSIALVAAVGVAAVGVRIAPAQGPSAASAPAPPPAPWANKFFLPDIATNREQPPPPVITHNFGEVPHGTLCVHKFTITNIYDVPMQIISVRKSCTCLDYVPMDRVLQPNETAEFTVMMNTGKFVGQNTQTFYVTFGPKYVSEAVIRVTATSRTEVTLNPGAVTFGTVPPGTRAVQTVSVKYSGRSRDWKLTEVVPVHGPFDVRFTEVSRGGPFRGGVEYQVEFALRPTAPPGTIAEQVTIKTNDPAQPAIHIAVSGTVAAPVEVAPNRVRFDGVKVGETGTQRVIVRAARPFRILGVDGSGEDVTVELPAATAPVPVQFLTIKFEPKSLGTVSRLLRIRTDLDGGTVLLPVEAQGVR